MDVVDERLAAKSAVDSRRTVIELDRDIRTGRSHVLDQQLSRGVITDYQRIDTEMTGQLAATVQ